MKISNRQKGQTLIETALILSLLLLIVLGITELSRWLYTKNSLKNAARQGARVAAVTPNLSDISDVCTNTDVVIKAVCDSPGFAKDKITVTVDVEGKTGTQEASSGDTVLVSVNYDYPDFFVVGGGIWPWPKNLNTTEQASMRYE